MATDTEGRASIPRMRTAAKIVAEIKAADPGTEVTEYYIRQLVKEGSVPVVWAGNEEKGPDKPGRCSFPAAPGDEPGGTGARCGGRHPPDRGRRAKPRKEGR